MEPTACQTGLGRELAGEGIIGLSTAFFYAGTSSVVMSLWNIPDTPTALFMYRFYSELKLGKAKASALQKAKQWLRGLRPVEVAALRKRLGLSVPGSPERLGGATVRSPSGKLTELKPFSRPYYWAGFVLTGDPD